MAIRFNKEFVDTVIKLAKEKKMEFPVQVFINVGTFYKGENVYEIYDYASQNRIQVMYDDELPLNVTRLTDKHQEYYVSGKWGV